MCSSRTQRPRRPTTSHVRRARARPRVAVLLAAPATGARVAPSSSASPADRATARARRPPARPPPRARSGCRPPMHGSRLKPMTQTDASGRPRRTARPAEGSSAQHTASSAVASGIAERERSTLSPSRRTASSSAPRVVPMPPHPCTTPTTRAPEPAPASPSAASGAAARAHVSRAPASARALSPRPPAQPRAHEPPSRPSPPCRAGELAAAYLCVVPGAAAGARAVGGASPLARRVRSSARSPTNRKKGRPWPLH